MIVPCGSVLCVIVLKVKCAVTDCTIRFSLNRITQSHFKKKRQRAIFQLRFSEKINFHRLTFKKLNVDLFVKIYYYK